MSSVPGIFYPPGSSDALPASLRSIDDRIALEVEGFSRQLEFGQLEISDRLASLPRRIHFPDGSLFSTRDNNAVDQMLTEQGHAPTGSIISFFESGWRWALLALAAIPLTLYLLFTIGMPIVAKPLAFAIPESVKVRLDEEIVDFLDQQLMKPSELSDVAKQPLVDKFEEFWWSEGTHIEFRKGGILGANALALPAGTIIVTDELVELIEFDGEFFAVMAHEVGHIRSNHSMRNIVQAAGISLVMGWMLGDLSLVTDIILVGVPTLLQQLSYSRTFESEADNYALFILQQEGYSSACFSSLIEKLSKSDEPSISDIPTYLSSHPSFESRIELGQSETACSDGPLE